MVSTRQDRALAIARAAGAEAMLAASPETVTWLTGYSSDIETGPNPYWAGAFALLDGSGPPLVVVPADEAAAVEAVGCEPITYEGFTIGELRPVERAASVLARVVGGRTVASEPGHLPRALGPLQVTDVTCEIARARAIKDDDEIMRLRNAVALCDAGQQAARDTAGAGGDELEIWAATRTAIERLAGTRIATISDIISGPRSRHVAGQPSARRPCSGELVICDLLPRLDGYWGDSTATFAVGEASRDASAAWRKVRDTLDALIDRIRPGVRACELDDLARGRLGYPHHTGHGLGASYHEEPRIVPGNQLPLEPRMVIALEPALYGDRFGIRLEQVVVVTDDGVEILSRHALEL